jgi:hypothetical protein
MFRILPSIAPQCRLTHRERNFDGSWQESASFRQFPVSNAQRLYRMLALLEAATNSVGGGEQENAIHHLMTPGFGPASSEGA